MIHINPEFETLRQWLASLNVALLLISPITNDRMFIFNFQVISVRFYLNNLLLEPTEPTPNSIGAWLLGFETMTSGNGTELELKL